VDKFQGPEAAVLLAEVPVPAVAQVPVVVQAPEASVPEVDYVSPVLPALLQVLLAEASILVPVTAPVR